MIESVSYMRNVFDKKKEYNAIIYLDFSILLVDFNHWKTKMKFPVFE